MALSLRKFISLLADSWLRPETLLTQSLQNYSFLRKQNNERFNN